MQGHMEPSANNTMPLDFSYCVQDQPSEPVILDLSCKTSLHSSVSCESGSTSSLCSENQSEEEEYPPKNRFDGPTFTETPPSVTESRNRIMYEVAYKCSNVTGRDMIGQLDGFPMLPMAVPMPMMPGMIPALFPPNHGAGMNLMGGTSAGLTTSFPNTSGGAQSKSMSSEQAKKATRPFKAYPKDPLTFTVRDQVCNTDSNGAYADFRKKMLDSVKRSSETNAKMRRVTKSPTQPTNSADEKDAAYWERRRKNNEAAKRSRDARRAKEDELAIRAAFCWSTCIHGIISMSSYDGRTPSGAETAGDGVR